jgi:hypothetical protein
MRVFCDIFLLAAVFFLPWWFMLIAASALFFVFSRFYELFLFAFLADLLYVGASPLGGSPFVLSTVALLLFFSFSWVRRRIRV